MRTEDDIRAAFRALAKQAPDDDKVLTAVREQADKAIAGPPQGVRRPMGRWMAPLAAAAAVIAVTAAAVAIADGRPHQPGPGTGALLDRLPPYYMTMLPFPGAPMAGPSVVVKDTRTGRTLVTALPPAPYHSFAGIAGAANDRTFVLAARPASGAVTQNSQNVEKLFRARLNPAKRTLTMTPLPIPVFTPGTLLDGMALSPGGTELAVALQTGRFHYQLEIRLYSLAGTLLKTWQSNGALTDDWLSPANISWARAGVLAINWRHLTRDARRVDYETGLWLLNTSTAAGNLAGQSRLVVPSAGLSGFYPWGDGLVSSNGRTAVVAMIRGPVGNPPVEPRIGGKIEEFAVATGQPVRALWRVHFGGPDSPTGFPSEQLMWSNASGSVLVLEANLASGPRSNGRTAIGVLRGNHFRPIPGAPSTRAAYYGLVF